jgi:hypothetical protein
MKKKISILFITIVLFMQLPFTSFAWGVQGHQIVVNLAFSLLSPTAKQKILRALGGEPLNNAAIWMDSVRENKVPKFQYMNDWHFLNMNENQTYQEVASEDDVVFNLQKAINSVSAIQQLSSDSIKMDLLILFHLMGDISQPLHCGYRIDEGGNKILVHTQKFNISRNNLHHVWDDIVIQEGKINLPACLNFYKSMTATAIDSVKAGNPLDWMMQSRSFFKNNVYAFTIVPKGISQLSLQYLDTNVPIVKQQLVYAAVRLAAVLEKAFGA